MKNHLIIFLISPLFSFNIILAQCNFAESRGFTKTALVIGEKTYNPKLGTLNNSAHDAKAIADSLRNIRFEVEEYIDLDFISLKKVVEEWLEKTKEYEVALFYFSGHGAEMGGINYLFPIDATPRNEFELGSQTYTANQIIYELTNNSGLKYAIVLLDACRNNPLTKGWKRNGNGGLASMNGGKNIFIGYAAEAGKTALDGYGNGNSPYTEAILKYINAPNLTIDQIYNKITRDVQLKTKDQNPYRTSSFNSDFCFNVKSEFESNSSPFIVPAPSIMAISKQTDEAFIIDSSKLLVKKLRSNSFIQIHTDTIRAYKIVEGKNSIYVLDSIRNYVFIIDKVTKAIKEKTKLKYTPISFTISKDEKKAFVSFKDNLYGGILILDFEKGNTEYFNLKYQVGSIMISNDGKSLYAFVSYPTTNYLYRYDSKHLKVIDSIKTQSQFENLSISNKGDLLFVSNKYQNQKNVLIFDTKNLKYLDTLFIEGTSFQFTDDSNYCVISNNSISILNLNNKKLLKNITTKSIPKAVALLDFEMYIWLPSKDRFFFKNLIGNLEEEDSLPLDAEQQFNIALKKIQEKAEMARAIQPFRIKDEFDFLTLQIDYQIGEIVQKLGEGYVKKFDNEKIDTLNSSYSVEIGILGSNGKSVLGNLSCEFFEEKIKGRIVDNNMKTEPFEYSIKSIEKYLDIRTIIKNFFYLRSTKLY